LIVMGVLTVAELAASDKELLELVSSYLSATVVSDDVDMRFESRYACSGVSGAKQPLHAAPSATSAASAAHHVHLAAWLAPSGGGYKQIATARSAIAAGATLMRLLSYCSQSPTMALDAAVVNEEHIERAVSLATAFIAANGLMPGMTTAGSSRGAAKEVEAEAEAEQFASTGSAVAGVAAAVAGGGKARASGSGRQAAGGGGEGNKGSEPTGTVGTGKTKYKVKMSAKKLLMEVVSKQHASLAWRVY
jgi:hypothetical protein